MKIRRGYKVFGLKKCRNISALIHVGKINGITITLYLVYLFRNFWGGKFIARLKARNRGEFFRGKSTLF